jgi:transcriptional regulator with XRE-family HTH domain
LPRFPVRSSIRALTAVPRRRVVPAVELRHTLAAEFACRRLRNRRYSLRAFARDLGTDHATLSQVLRGRRVLSPRFARELGRRLHLPAAAVCEACEQHHAEAIVRLARRASFRPDSRWIATRTGLPLDAVNAALARLVHERRLIMRAAHEWIFP